jgi:hypothetical protein
MSDMPVDAEPLAGNVTELISKVLGHRITSPRDWQANLGIWTTFTVAAHERTPADVATLARHLPDEIDRDVVLDAAADREAAELAQLTIEFIRADQTRGPTGSLARAFVQRIFAKGGPVVSAAFLSALAEHDVLYRWACEELLNIASLSMTVRTILHLHGMSSAAVHRLLAAAAQPGRSEGLARLLIQVSQLGDAEAARSLTGTAAAWHLPEEPSVPDVSSLANLVQELLKDGADRLAYQLIEQTLEGYRDSRERYRFLALVFVFQQRGLDAEAKHVLRDIVGVEMGPATKMIIDFCQTEQPEQTAYLVQAILTDPDPDGIIKAAVQFAQELEPTYRDIFATVATWPSVSLVEFAQRLCRVSGPWASEFRDVVIAAAPARDNGAEIADLINWLLADETRRRSKKHVRDIITRVVTEREPLLLVQLIDRLHDSATWRDLRDMITAQVCDGYDASKMASFIAAPDSRVATSLWLAMHWLQHRVRRVDDVVRIVASLRDAKPRPNDLNAALSWSASVFKHLPERENDPVQALLAYGLVAEARAWSQPSGRKPDPEEQ